MKKTTIKTLALTLMTALIVSIIQPATQANARTLLPSGRKMEAPQNLSLTVAAKQVTLSWTFATRQYYGGLNTTGYVVYRKVKGVDSKYVKVGSVKTINKKGEFTNEALSGTISFTDTKYTPKKGETVYYRIRGYSDEYTVYNESTKAYEAKRQYSKYSTVKKKIKSADLTAKTSTPTPTPTPVPNYGGRVYPGDKTPTPTPTPVVTPTPTPKATPTPTPTEDDDYIRPFTPTPTLQERYTMDSRWGLFKGNKVYQSDLISMTEAEARKRISTYWTAEEGFKFADHVRYDNKYGNLYFVTTEPNSYGIYVVKDSDRSGIDLTYVSQMSDDPYVYTRGRLRTSNGYIAYRPGGMYMLVSNFILDDAYILKHWVCETSTIPGYATLKISTENIFDYIKPGDILTVWGSNKWPDSFVGVLDVDRVNKTVTVAGSMLDPDTWILYTVTLDEQDIIDSTIVISTYYDDPTSSIR